MERTVTELTVTKDNIFCEGGALLPEGILENFAQTCAARIGYINKYILHREVNIGFIGAVKNWTLERMPSEGETLETTLDVIQEIGPMVKVSVEGKTQKGTVARGEMTIALSDIEKRS